MYLVRRLKLFYTLSHSLIQFSLYFQATFKGWMDIMYAAVDSREVIITVHYSIFSNSSIQTYIRYKLSLILYINVYFVSGKLLNYLELQLRHLMAKYSSKKALVLKY